MATPAARPKKRGRRNARLAIAHRAQRAVPYNVPQTDACHLCAVTKNAFTEFAVRARAPRSRLGRTIRVNRDGSQGRQLARASLAVGYAIGIFGLLITIMSVLGAYT